MADTVTSQTIVDVTGTKTVMKFTNLSDGLSKGRVIRPVQTNYGVALCGENFVNNPLDVNERKFQKALQVIERIAAMGVTNTEELPYYKIN